MSHVSELAIDRFLAGEHADAGAFTAHVDHCPRCTDALAEARSTRDDFPAFEPITAIRSSRRWLAIAPVLAAAAALAVFGWPTHRDPVVRTKGGPSFGFYVQHEGQVRRGSGVLAPNDSIEFTTTTSEPLWFAVTSIDAGATTPTVYVPAQRVNGVDQTLAVAIQVDGTDETITGMFCHEPFDPLAPLPADCSTERIAVTKR